MTFEPTTSTAALKVAVLGPGAVGGLVAATLARLGDQVTCIAGPATAAVLAADGLTLDSERFGSGTVHVGSATVLDHPVDVCFVAVKATSLASALIRVPADVLGGALLIPLLNGVEHVSLLREAYPAAKVVAATLRVESTRTSVGRVHQVSPFATVELAATPGSEPARSGDGRTVLLAVAEHLRVAGFDLRVVASEVDVLWSKFAFLAPLALLTTSTQSPIGVVRTEQRADLVAVLGEVCAVGRAEGAQLEAESVLAFCDSVPATMMSSMQRDAAAGRATEVDALGGAICRAAARHGIDVPVTTRLVRDLTPL